MALALWQVIKTRKRHERRAWWVGQRKEEWWSPSVKMREAQSVCSAATRIRQVSTEAMHAIGQVFARMHACSIYSLMCVHPSFLV